MATSLRYPPSTGPDPYRVLVVPVIEPGQAFNDSDLANLAAALRGRLLNDVEAFFAENSFGDLDVDFTIFGHDVAARTRPLQLPRAIRSYWNPRFEPGGFVARQPGFGADTNVLLDGTEQLTLAVTPRQRAPQELPVTMSALSAESTHGAFPVTVSIPAATVRLEVTDKNGTSRELAVAFTATSFSVNADTVTKDLAAIATHVDGRIKAATAALTPNLPAAAPDLLQPVRLRRVQGASGAVLGTLVLDISVHPDYGDGSATVQVVSPAAPAPLGLDTAVSAVSSVFLLPLENARLQAYLRRRLELAQEAAGFGGANQLLGDPVVTAPGGTLTITVRLSQGDGGEGASLSVKAQAGLDKLGFATTTAVTGVGTAGTSLTVREPLALFGDVLTLLNTALGTGDQTKWLTDQDFRCVHVVFLGSPPGSAPTWNAGAADLGGTKGTPRVFRTWTTVTHATDATIQVQANWVTSIVSSDAAGALDVGKTCHELSHTLGMVDLPPGVPGERCLGLPDTYDNDPENQNQLRYLDKWDLMAEESGLPHLVGHHKRHLGWIPPGRIQPVDLPVPSGPVPSGPTGTECWLVPVEHWDATIESRVRAAIAGLPGANLPIRQLMDIALPGDGGRMLMVEARAKGTRFSQQLPLDPGSSVALLVTDAIACSDPTRYVVSYKYRRFVHPLNLGGELDTVDNTLDLSTVPELSYEGTRVTVVARQDVGSVPVLRTRVDRDKADFIDLKFTDANPPWQCPDIWIDWLGNGREPYPPGSPFHQGDTVWFPKTGTEPHKIVARVWNGGTVDALNVDVRFYLCQPPGAGDQGQWPLLGNSVLGLVPKKSFTLAEVPWNVSSANTEHQCVLAQIADWDVPQQAGGGPVPVFEATTDLWLSNNRGQKNIIDFQLLAGSPYQPRPIPLQIANDGPEELEVYLEPVGLPAGVTITCTPRTLRVPPRGTAQFLTTVNGNSAVLPVGAASDATFLVHACRWTRDRENVEAFGGWQMTLRPRQATTMTISASAVPPGVSVTGTVAEAGSTDHVWVRMAAGSGPPTWKQVPVLAGGAFAASFASVPIGATTVQLEARFDGNALLASATAGPINLPVGGVSLPGGGGPGGGGPILTTGQTPIGGGPVLTGLGLPTAGPNAEPNDG